jgi:hypothetical protein
MLNCYSFKLTFKDSTSCSTWLQSPITRNIIPSINYSNLAYFNSLESKLLSAPSYQNFKFVANPVRSCTIKPERVLRRQLVQFDYRPPIT